MNRADVVLLNNSLDQLGNSLLQRQVMAQRNTEIANQATDRAAQRQLQSQQLDVANQRYGAAQKHWEETEKRNGLHDALQQVSEAGKSFNESLSSLGQQVREGGMSPDMATNYFKSGVDQLPDEVKSRMLAMPQINAAYNGGMDWSKVGVQPEPDIQPKPFTAGGVNGVYNPKSGSFQTAPTPKVERPYKITSPNPADPNGKSTVTQSLTEDEWQAANAPQLAPLDPSQRQVGKDYLSQDGAVGTWTGKNWLLKKPAPKRSP